MINGFFLKFFQNHLNLIFKNLFIILILLKTYSLNITSGDTIGSANAPLPTLSNHVKIKFVFFLNFLSKLNLKH